MKLLVMSPITIMFRVTTGRYMNLEDVQFGEKDPEKQKRGLVPYEPINRVKRAHINDIENIVPFCIISLMYIATQPAVATAVLLFKVFTATRLAHSVIYLFAIPQPCRLIAFLVGFGVNIFMVEQVIMTAYYKQ